MEKLEIIVNLYTIENRLQNSKLDEKEKSKLKIKFRHYLLMLNEYKEYENSTEFNDPKDIINYFKIVHDFYKDFNTKKTRDPKYVRFRYIAIAFIKHIFNKVTNEEIVKNFCINRTNVSAALRSLKDDYDTDDIFKKEFNYYQIDILGDLKIFS